MSSLIRAWEVMEIYGVARMGVRGTAGGSGGRCVEEADVFDAVLEFGKARQISFGAVI